MWWSTVVPSLGAITVALCVLLLDLLLVIRAVNAENRNLDHLFRDRSHSEWKEVWHRERYARCRETLLKHLEWACEKDIYRITRRSDPLLTDYSIEQEDDNSLQMDNAENGLEERRYPLLSDMSALQMLRYRRGNSRRSGNSITAECCSSAGCTWEEYAEYCPTNKRRTTFYIKQ